MPPIRDSFTLLQWNNEQSGDGVKEAVRVIAELITHNQGEPYASALASVTEVDVQTALAVPVEEGEISSRKV